MRLVMSRGRPWRRMPRPKRQATIRHSRRSSSILPVAGSQVSNIVTITADATDNVGVAGVQFFVDGTASGSEDTTDPYAFTWDTRTVNNGAHTLTALARDVNGNTKLSAPITVNVANAN